MIHLINRKFNEDTTDCMLFDPIVEKIKSEYLSDQVFVWANSPSADYNLAKSVFSLRYIKLILTKIKKNDTVFITSTPPFQVIILLFFKFFKNFNVIFQIQDLYPDFLKFVSKKYKILYYLIYPFAYLLYKKVDKFITISDSIKDYFSVNYKIKKSKIYVIENWSDIEQINFSPKNISNKIVYIGNIGKAHDCSYFTDYLLKSNNKIKFSIKTDSVSKLRVSSSLTSNLEKLKNDFEGRIVWINKRFNKHDLSNYLISFDYSMIFLGKDFDKVLFPCKIYASLDLLIPIIFFGPKNSEILIWLVKNNLGFHYSEIQSKYKNLNLYRESIEKFNFKNSNKNKIKSISNLLLE